MLAVTRQPCPGQAETPAARRAIKMLMKNRLPDLPAQRRQKGAATQLDLVGEAGAPMVGSHGEAPRQHEGLGEAPRQQGGPAQYHMHNMDDPEATPDGPTSGEDY